MKSLYSILLLSTLMLACSSKTDKSPITEIQNLKVDTSRSILTSSPEEEFKIKIEIKKDLLYDKHTLADVYPYKDTSRMFQWDKIEKYLFLVDSIQLSQKNWAVLQNYKNKNGEAPLVKVYHRDQYKRISDSLGVERYQSVPLYIPTDSVPIRYGRDGSLVRILQSDTMLHLVKAELVGIEGEWKIPSKYIKFINDTVVFKKVICVDLTNQNVATLEKSENKWLVRSMNPVTTGVHRPPHAQETPVGLFVIQEKKSKMFYLVDGTQDIAGFAPYASRFTNGAYFHGVALKGEQTELIEYSSTLGTKPRSHMCVRNATSHAKFIYNWAPIDQTLVFIYN